MADFTPNMNLEKPLETESYSIHVFNANADIIDAEVTAARETADNAAIAAAEAVPLAVEEAEGLIAAHDASPDAHPLIQNALQTADGRIARLEDMFLNNVTGNPFLVTFGDLGGLVVSGVWNEALARVEF